MASRPESDVVLTKAELDEFSRRLSMLSTQGIENAYLTAYKECRFDGTTLPPAAAIQQLVTTWKLMRKFRR